MVGHARRERAFFIHAGIKFWTWIFHFIIQVDFPARIDAFKPFNEEVRRDSVGFKPAQVKAP